jgi:hypothetical protein
MILRRAWDEYRLDAIRSAVGETIVLLQQSDPRDVLGRDFATPEAAAPASDPVGHARDACCDELRDASGMPDDAGRADRKVSIYRQRAPQWSASYDLALDKYREVASQALKTSLRKHRRG